MNQLGLIVARVSLTERQDTSQLDVLEVSEEDCRADDGRDSDCDVLSRNPSVDEDAHKIQIETAQPPDVHTELCLATVIRGLPWPRIAGVPD